MVPRPCIKIGCVSAMDRVCFGSVILDSDWLTSFFVLDSDWLNLVLG